MPARRCRDCSDGGSKNNNITRALAGCKNPRLCTAASREKHEQFMRSTKKNIADMPVSILPGVSCADARRLCKYGFRTVDSLTEKLVETGQDRLCFVNWLVCAAGMRRQDAQLCYCALLNWHNLNEAARVEEESGENDQDAENERDQEQEPGARANGGNRTSEKPGTSQGSKWTGGQATGPKWTCKCYISQNDVGDDGDQTWDNDQTEERRPNKQRSPKRHMSAMDALVEITRTISRVKMPRGKRNGTNTKDT